MQIKISAIKQLEIKCNQKIKEEQYILQINKLIYKMKIKI